MIRVLDGKTWRSRVKWRAPNKYDIVKLVRGPADTRASSSNLLPLYIVGRDNEVLYCNIPLQMAHQQKRKGKRDQEGLQHVQQKKNRVDEVKEGLSDTSACTSETAPKAAPVLHHTELPSASKLRLSHHR